MVKSLIPWKRTRVVGLIKLNNLRSIALIVLVLSELSLGVTSSPRHWRLYFPINGKSPKELAESWKKMHPNEIGVPYHFWSPSQFYVWVDDKDNVYYDCKGRARLGRPSDLITCTETYVQYTHWGDKRIKTTRISEEILQINDDSFACKVNWRTLPKTPSDCTKDGWVEKKGSKEWLEWLKRNNTNRSSNL